MKAILMFVIGVLVVGLVAPDVHAEWKRLTYPAFVSNPGTSTYGPHGANMWPWGNQIMGAEAHLTRFITPFTVAMTGWGKVWDYGLGTEAAAAISDTVARFAVWVHEGSHVGEVEIYKEVKIKAELNLVVAHAAGAVLGYSRAYHSMVAPGGGATSGDELCAKLPQNGAVGATSSAVWANITAGTSNNNVQFPVSVAYGAGPRQGEDGPWFGFDVRCPVAQLGIDQRVFAIMSLYANRSSLIPSTAEARGYLEWSYATINPWLLCHPTCPGNSQTVGNGTTQSGTPNQSSPCGGAPGIIPGPLGGSSGTGGGGGGGGGGATPPANN